MDDATEYVKKCWYRPWYIRLFSKNARTIHGFRRGLIGAWMAIPATGANHGK